MTGYKHPTSLWLPKDRCPIGGRLVVEMVEAKLAEGEEVRLVVGGEVREVREAGTWRRRHRHRWHREAYSMHLPQSRMK